MPPPTRKSKAPRTEEFLRVRDRELELKRISGEISCFECRRLKLKCDKKIPCVQCVRRGCKHICPTGRRRSEGGDGALQQRSARVGSSMTEQDRMRAHISALSERVRLLEDALQDERDRHGVGEKHPLLKRELRAIRDKEFLLEDDEGGIGGGGRGAGGSGGGSGSDEDTLHGFGTLTISEGQAIQYIGASAIENTILLDLLGRQGTQDDTPNASPSSSSERAGESDRWHLFSTSHHVGIIGPELVSRLPSFERAKTLFQCYIVNVAWIASPVKQEQITDELIPLFYPNGVPVSPESMKLKQHHMGDLALLFILLACGTIGDFTQPPQNPEGEAYSQIARAALGTRDVLSETSLTIVQAVMLLAVYETSAWHKSALEKSWKISAVGADLAISVITFFYVIGLHRDPIRWKLSTTIIERRRRLFWEMFDFDVWRSIEFGRPPSFPLTSVDCEQPLDDEADLNEAGEHVESVWSWRYRFARDVMYKVAEQMCSIHPLKYRDVLLLDKKIRGFPLHPYVTNPPKRVDMSPEAFVKSLHPIVTSWYRESLLLLVHHNFFAKAILESPTNPRRSSFAASYLAAHRSASFLINATFSNYRVTKYFMLRIWSVWSILLVSAIIVGSVASLGPVEDFSVSASADLDHAIKIFEEAGHTITSHALPLLYRLRERANKALSESLDSQPSSDSEKKGKLGTQGFFNELQLLHRTTRVIEQRKSSPVASPPSSDFSASTPGSTADTSQTSSHMSQDDRTYSKLQATDMPLVRSESMSGFPVPGVQSIGEGFLSQDHLGLGATSVSRNASGVSNLSTRSSPSTDGGLAKAHEFMSMGDFGRLPAAILPNLGPNTDFPVKKEFQPPNAALPWMELMSQNIPMEALYSQLNMADVEKLGLFNLQGGNPATAAAAVEGLISSLQSGNAMGRVEMEQFISMSDPLLTSYLDAALDSDSAGVGGSGGGLEMTASEDVWQSLMNQTGFSEQSLPIESESMGIPMQQDGGQSGLHLLNGWWGCNVDGSQRAPGSSFF